MTPLYILIFAFVVAAAIAVPILGGFGKKTKGKTQKYGNAITLDKKFIQDKWAEIETQISSGGASQLKTGIMEADKLVDYALKARGVPGETMGERMKNAKNKFSDHSDYNNLWFAHKVRNNIAHEASHDLNIGEARRATEYFKKALRDLGAL